MLVDDINTVTFDFLSTYQILEKAAVTRSGADISATNSVLIAELINTVDPLVNTSTNQVFGIPISESKKESTSTRDHLVSMVAAGYLNSTNKVFSRNDFCLLPKQVLNSASWKKQKYHKKSIVGKLPVLNQIYAKSQSIEINSNQGKPSGLITMNHGATIEKLNKIKENVNWKWLTRKMFKNQGLSLN